MNVSAATGYELTVEYKLVLALAKMASTKPAGNAGNPGDPVFEHLEALRLDYLEGIKGLAFMLEWTAIHIFETTLEGA